MEFLDAAHPIRSALFATTFTYFTTALGAATVFLTRDVSRKLLDGMLGFAAGVMISASFWSLLAPAVEYSKGGSLPSFFPPSVGFFVGGLFLFLMDRIIPHLHIGFETEEAEGISTRIRKTYLFILAMTLHNIPEGLTVGVVFGALGAVESSPELSSHALSLSGAVALTLGMALQNFPEGMAVSLPMRQEGFSRWKSFTVGQLSGIVEPIAGIFGAYFVLTSSFLLPYALGFAAGAMIYVVIEEVIPESHRAGNDDIATTGAMVGFLLMMVLDLSFS
jgi:ZIP family zinc transporter